MKTDTIQIFNTTLHNCSQAEGIVVVVDVLRAFTSAAYAFHRGAVEIILVSTIDEAFALRQQNPEYLLMGEVNGYPVKGFDLPNSPSTIQNLDLKKRHLVLRTTAGTQGVVRAAHAEHLFVASLSVATPTADIIKTLSPDRVTFVNTGVRTKGGGEEDIACSAFIASLIQEDPISTADIQARVKTSSAAAKFSNPDNPDFPHADLAHALIFDQFRFAMKVSRTGDRLILRQAHNLRNAT